MAVWRATSSGRSSTPLPEPGGLKRWGQANHRICSLKKGGEHIKFAENPGEKTASSSGGRESHSNTSNEPVDSAQSRTLVLRPLARRPSASTASEDTPSVCPSSTDTHAQLPSDSSAPPTDPAQSRTVLSKEPLASLTTRRVEAVFLRYFCA